MKKNLWIFLLGAAVIVALDQITKSWITTHFALHDSEPVINGFFNLVYVMNKGAAFSIFANASETFRSIFFKVITIAVLILIIYYVATAKLKSLMAIASLTMIFGGALGNLIDRFRFGAVVDFLDVYVGTMHWPAFNVADAAITVGAILMIWEMVLHRESKETKAK